MQLLEATRSYLHRPKHRHQAAAALIGGAVVSLGFLAWGFYRQSKRSASLNQPKTADVIRDKSLKDTFPASDPPASQFFDIPVNRQ